MSGLILPGNPLFDLTLATPPPSWGQVAARDGNTYAFVAELGSGLMRPVTQAELTAYLEGGEYDDRMAEIGETEEHE